MVRDPFHLDGVPSPFWWLSVGYGSLCTVLGLVIGAAALAVAARAGRATAAPAES